MDLCNAENVKRLLARRGFRFSKSMGQNFLTASWVPERLAAEAGIDGGSVLEIGPGIGTLTVRIAERAKRVVSVELDTDLLPILKETLSGCGNVEVVQGDVLKLDLAALTAEKLPETPRTVCANLPYNITSPVIAQLIDSRCFESMTVLLQREAAQRMCARAGTADYSAFTVYVQLFTEPEILFDVPAECFTPAPKVVSSAIKLRMRETIPEVGDRELFFKVVKAAFAQRRKTLVNALSAGLGLPKSEAEQAVVSAGFDARIRGEALDIAGFAAVASQLATGR